MRRYYRLCFALLLCVTLWLQLAACQATVGTMSDEMRAEIVDYYGYTGTDSANTVAGMRYYGTYNGYVILMDAGMLGVNSAVDIGGRIFRWGSGALTLEAYKDGQAQPLKAVYEAGDISEKDLDSILEMHKAHFIEVHNYDYNAE